MLRNAKGLTNALVGGWQLAGFWQLNSSYTTLTTNYYGPYNNIQIYGKKYPIQNCQSGVCYPGYLYWNGYIQANLINRTDASGNQVLFLTLAGFTKVYDYAGKADAGLIIGTTGPQNFFVSAG